MRKKERTYAHTAELLEELLLLLTVGHGQILKTAGQTLLDILEDTSFGFVCVFYLYINALIDTSLLQILEA